MEQKLTLPAAPLTGIFFRFDKLRGMRSLSILRPTENPSFARNRPHASVKSVPLV